MNSQNSLVVLDGLEEFREHLGGELTITLLRAIGQGFEAHEIDGSIMNASSQELEQHATEGSATLRASA